MAEGILKKILKDKKKSGIEVYSSGIYADTGAYATDDAITVTKELYNVDLIKHRATNIRESKIKDMDIILCATYSHKITVQNLYPQIKEKVYTMKEYAYGKNAKNMDIKDPWGYTIQVYINCAKEIHEVLEKIADKI